MLKRLKMFACGWFLLVIIWVPSATAGKMPVAVLEFDVIGEFEIKGAGSIIAEWMVGALARTNAFDLKERVLLKKVLKEQELSVTGLIDDQTAAGIGKLYGVTGVVSGSVLRWENTLSVTARLIDTTTGTILRTADMKVTKADQIPGRMDQLARTLVEAEMEPVPLQEPLAESTPVASDKTAVGNDVLIAPKAGQIWKEKTSGLEFAWVPGGCFSMGQSEEEKDRVIREEGEALYKKNYADEDPSHKVCLDGFWMGRHEVTNAQFQAFMPTHDSGSYKGQNLNEASLPVTYVSWEQSRSFADWLTASSDSSHKFRLPTEAEWEFACRAGTSGERFWGDDSDLACKFANVYDRVAKKADPCPWQHHDCDDDFVATSPVGYYFPNPLGLHDMLGNVWEWTADGYNPEAYRSHARFNPLNTTGDTKVRRGGSWADSPGSIRCSNRGKRSPDRQNNQVGFRLVMY